MMILTPQGPAPGIDIHVGQNRMNYDLINLPVPCPVISKDFLSYLWRAIEAMRLPFVEECLSKR